MKKQLCGLAGGLLAAFTLRVSAADYLPGDISGNGQLDSSDAVLMSRILAEDRTVDFTEIVIEAADVNADGAWTTKDLSAILYGTRPAPQTQYILEPKGAVHTGEATYYDGGYEGGCAGLDPDPAQVLICAMNASDYNCAELAGAYLAVTGEGGTVNVLVTDLLPIEKPGALDLCTEAFPFIAPLAAGRVPISWQIIPLPSAENAPVSYRFQGKNPNWWCTVQIRNHRYPVETLEYLNKDGEYVALPRQNHNVFAAENGLGEGPFTFRITDIYGQSVIDTGVAYSTDGLVQGHVQLPL